MKLDAGLGSKRMVEQDRYLPRYCDNGLVLSLLTASSNEVQAPLSKCRIDVPPAIRPNGKAFASDRLDEIAGCVDDAYEPRLV